jgi:hypothetical protein
MARYLYDIIGSCHDMKIIVFVKVPGISSLIIPLKPFKITLLESLIIVPQGKHKSRWQWKFDYNISKQLFLLNFLSVVIQYFDFKSWERLGTGSSLCFKGFRFHKVGCNERPCLCLPIGVSI